MKQRVWTEEAHQKRSEGCRVCGYHEVELAHVSGRVFDQPRTPGAKTVYVEPESVVPLCPEHHKQYDAHALDLLSYLQSPEQIRAVSDYGSIEIARRRLCPSEYQQERGLSNQLGTGGGDEGLRAALEAEVARRRKQAVNYARFSATPYPRLAVREEKEADRLHAILDANPPATPVQDEVGEGHRNTVDFTSREVLIELPDGSEAKLVGYITESKGVVAVQQRSDDEIDSDALRAALPEPNPAPEGQHRYTVEQARMRLREAWTVHEWPEDGTSFEYFARAAFPDPPKEQGDDDLQGGDIGMDSKRYEAMLRAIHPTWISFEDVKTIASLASETDTAPKEQGEGGEDGH
jgi:hypothetical protein